MKIKLLQSNCSEYVCRIKLTAKELKAAKKMAKKFKFSSKDLKYFEDELENGTDEDEMSIGSFINEGFAQPYEFIKETIKEKRAKAKKMKKMILQANCSEQVFKLAGDLKEIKKEVGHMLDDIEKDNPQLTKRIDVLRKKIAGFKELKDFEDISFPFTTNYETFFKIDHKNKDDLLVATCNNVEWSSVDYENVDDDEKGYSYHDIAKGTDYELIFKDKNTLLFYNSYYQFEKEVGYEEYVLAKSEGIDVSVNQDYKIKSDMGRKFVVQNSGTIIQLELVDDEKLKKNLLVLVAISEDKRKND